MFECKNHPGRPAGSNRGRFAYLCLECIGKRQAEAEEGRADERAAETPRSSNGAKSLTKAVQALVPKTRRLERALLNRKSAHADANEAMVTFNAGMAEVRSIAEELLK